jgi:hypothetical protein
MNQKHEMSWLKQPGEGTKAHAAATTYFSLGPSRSLVAVGKALGKSTKLVEKWSAKYQWVERANDYDARIEQTELEAYELFVQQEAKKWAQRAEEEREDLHLIRKLLRARAKEMLKYPLATITQAKKRDETGRPIENTVVNPARWTMDSVPHLIQASLAVDAAIRNDGATRPDIQEIDVFDDLVPFKSSRK